MNHSDHVSLLRGADIKPGSVWADLGSGDGAFTLALRDLGGPTIKIYSVDRDQNRLEQQKDNFLTQFTDSKVTFVNQDFTDYIQLPKLDGILMANSLHFVKDKRKLLHSLLRLIHNKGTFLLVEYNTDIPNYWVPYPLSFSSFKNLSKKLSLQEPILNKTIASNFMNEIYSASSKIKV